MTQRPALTGRTGKKKTSWDVRVMDVVSRWVITVGGQFAGNPDSTVISASTPPVEDPIATIASPGTYSGWGGGSGTVIGPS
jgi:hypothetical protein